MMGCFGLMKKLLIDMAVCLCFLLFILPIQGKAATNVNFLPPINGELETELAENSVQTSAVGEGEVIVAPALTTSLKSRYTVLVLDSSGSMGGAPILALQEGALKFCDSMLSANGENYVAIIVYSGSAWIACDFTMDLGELENAINGLYADGGTNTGEALTLAGNMLAQISDTNAIRNIVLCSDGLPEHGDVNYDGPYTYDDYEYYEHANAAYNAAKALPAEYSVHTLGFFHSLEGNYLEFGRRFMQDIQTDGYHEVTDPEELVVVIEDDIVEEVLRTVINGEFSYESGGQNYQADYYYDDAYFYETNYDNYDEHLSAMSLCMALSAFGSANGDPGDYTGKSENLQILLEDTGFMHFGVNDWFLEKPQKDSIGVAAAYKSLAVPDEDGNEETYTLVALAIRGGGYESEWASNFKIGLSGEHQGFAEASAQVLEFLEAYLAETGIQGKVKLWITGYSRAAATANLTAGAINLGKLSLPAGITLDTQNDMYAYCFEAPAGAISLDVAKDKRHLNIFNIINSNDIVTKVAPAALGFGRYGVDRYLPTAENSSSYAEQKHTMIARLDALDSHPAYIVDDFKMQSIKFDWTSVLPGGDPFITITDDNNNNLSQSAFLDDFLRRLVVEFIKTRDNYVANLQDGVGEAMVILNTATGEEMQALARDFTERIKDRVGELILKYVNPFMSESEAFDVIAECLNESLKSVGISVDDPSAVERAAKSICDLLLAVGSNHPNLSASAVLNLDSITQAHFPEICLAWLQSMDEQYENGMFSYLSSGDYRVIRINCPVDVSVSTGGIQVASISGDAVSDANILVTAINENGEKIVYLPADGEYDIDLTATEAGEVSVGLSEFCAQSGNNTRQLLYTPVAVVQGDTLSVVVPSYAEEDLAGNTSEGTDTAYKMYDSADREVAVELDLRGEQAVAAYYTVDLVSVYEDYGVVQGSGTYQAGEFAQVTAAPFSGCTFVGWYANDVCLSEEAEYRFCVTENTELEARFVKGEIE